jgi:hypothetical protein
MGRALASAKAVPGAGNPMPRYFDARQDSEGEGNFTMVLAPAVTSSRAPDALSTL